MVGVGQVCMGQCMVRVVRAGGPVVVGVGQVDIGTIRRWAAAAGFARAVAIIYKLWVCVCVCFLLLSGSC